jgi:hypothetical protein
MPEGPDPVLYPDVVAAGDLRAALQTAFDTAGVALSAEHPGSPGWVHVGATVTVGDRFALVVCAEHVRAFTLECYRRGVVMARGSTDDLTDTATAIATFCSGAGVRDLVAACPHLESGGFAEAFERGEPEAIEYTWRRYCEPPPSRARWLVDLHDFLVAAAEEPRLRVLFPFTSHEFLGLRLSPRHDVRSRTVAWVRPFGDGRYLVSSDDDNRALQLADLKRWTGEPVPGVLGPAPAREAVALVLAVMG